MAWLTNTRVQYYINYTDETTANIDIMIEEAESCVERDISSIFTSTQIANWADTSNTPQAIQDLTLYKCCEYVLIRVYQNRIQDGSTNEDIKAWETKYNNLLEMLKQGQVIVSFSGSELNPTYTTDDDDIDYDGLDFEYLDDETDTL